MHNFPKWYFKDQILPFPDIFFIIFGKKFGEKYIFEIDSPIKKYKIAVSAKLIIFVVLWVPKLTFISWYQEFASSFLWMVMKLVVNAMFSNNPAL